MNVFKTAVILVHYENYAEKYFSDCYESLVRQNVPHGTFTVFVVNNGSKAVLSATGPLETRFVECQENLGWGAGNNRAIRIALDEGFDTFVMLNMDMTLDSDWLKCLLEAASRRPDTAILQSKVLLHANHRINSVGNRTHFLGYGYCHGYGRERADTPPVIHFASGASMLVKGDVFRTIGLFREDYFMYYEDMEFCWRARLAGFRVGLAEKSICFHKYNFSHKWKFLYCLERNRLLTVFTLLKPGTLILIAPALVLAQILSGIYFFMIGYKKDQGKLLSFFFRRKTWRAIFDARQNIRRLRQMKDSQIVMSFSGTIFFAEIKNPLLTWFLNPLLWVYWNLVKYVIFW